MGPKHLPLKTLGYEGSNVRLALHFLSRSDIKEDNVLVDRQINLMIVDFGQARRIPSRKSQLIGEPLGTVDYLSPEELCGKHHWGVPSEVFKLGLLMFKVIAGRYAYEDPRESIRFAPDLPEDCDPGKLMHWVL